MREHPHCHVVAAYPVAKFADLVTAFTSGLYSLLRPSFHKASDSTDPLEFCQLPLLGDQHFLLVVRLVYGSEAHDSIDWLFYKKFSPTLISRTQDFQATSNNATESSLQASKEKCNNCNKGADQMRLCPICNVAQYCSRSCLRSHKKRHSKVCRKMQIFKLVAEQQEKLDRM